MGRNGIAKAFSERAQFSLQDTFAAKGVATLLLLTHHLFYEGATDTWDIRSLLSDENLLSLGLLCKVCVSIFTLLSAYGMSVQYKKRLQSVSPSLPVYGINAEFCARRYLSLMQGYWFVFALALVFTSFTARAPLFVYGSSDGGLWNGFVDAMGLAYWLNTPTLNPTWWYMWVAIYVILLFPLLYRWCEKDGLIVFIASIIVYPFIPLDPPVLPCAILGVCFAQRNLFVRLRALANTPARRVTFGIVLLGLLSTLYIMRTHLSIPYFVDTALAPVIVFSVFFFFPAGSLLNRILAFVGKHAGNIFLTHTFIFSYYLGRVVYGVHYPVLIVLFLLLLSLALSMLLERIKNFIGYNALFARLKDKLCTGIRYLCARKAYDD